MTQAAFLFPSGYAVEVPLQEVLYRAATQQASAPAQPPLTPAEYLACPALHQDSASQDYGLPARGLSVGWSGARGRRPAMEDAFALYEFPGSAMLAVFDGHGGGEVADAATRVVPETIEQYIQALTGAEQQNPAAVRRALKDAFSAKNPYVHHIPTIEERLMAVAHSGSTAVVALFMDSGLYIANLGDSRAILIMQNGSAVRLSVDHKPDDACERNAIERRGGRVTQEQGDVARVEATLATSRALGDWELPLVRRPQVTFVGDTSRALALVLGCDGIFDTLNDRAVADLVLRELPHHLDSPATVAEYLLNAAYNRGSRDNMTAVVVPLQRP